MCTHESLPGKKFSCNFLFLFFFFCVCVCVCVCVICTNYTHKYTAYFNFRRTPLPPRKHETKQNTKNETKQNKMIILQFRKVVSLSYFNSMKNDPPFQKQFVLEKTSQQTGRIIIWKFRVGLWGFFLFFYMLVWKEEFWNVFLAFVGMGKGFLNRKML